MADDDDEQAMYSYASSHNISMQGGDELGMTKAEWRALSWEEKSEIIQDIVNDLVEVWVEDE